ncbi:MAG: type II toxin-antitoxin system HicA family toxin [Chloroflexi bacterium]|nr:type II toxin-antitoxin system HicA family toxin [Chloroflexota bacterium]
MSPRLPRVTAIELLRALQRDGWEVRRREGSHFQLKHPSRRGRITLTMHAGITVKPKVLATVLSEAGLTVTELRRLL